MGIESSSGGVPAGVIPPRLCYIASPVRAADKRAGTCMAARGLGRRRRCARAPSPTACVKELPRAACTVNSSASPMGPKNSRAPLWRWCMFPTFRIVCAIELKSFRPATTEPTVEMIITAWLANRLSLAMSHVGSSGGGRGGG